MRRTFALLVALGLVLATAGPAMAARKDKPPGNPADYEVTMTFDNGGLETTCGDGDSITMTGNLEGGVLRADGAKLDTNIVISDELELSGCHGGAATVVVPDGATPPEVFAGAMWLDFGPGDTVTLQWRFDYYWEFEQNPKNGKLTQKTLEFSALTSTPMSFDPMSFDGQTMEGDFTLRRFTKTDSARGAWEDLGEATGVSFQLTITPKS